MIRRGAHSSSATPTGRPRLARAVMAVRPLTTREKLGWTLTFLVVGGLALWLLWPVFSLLFASMVFAWLCSGPVRRLEARGLSRTAGTALVFGGFVLTVATAMLIVIPAVAQQISELSGNVDTYLQRAAQAVGPAAAWIHKRTGVHVPVNLSALQAELPGWLAKLSPDARQSIQDFLSGLFTSGMGFVLGLANLLLVPVFTFYLTRDWELLMGAATSLIPPRQRPRVLRLASEVDARLTAFVRGQITLCVILGVLYSLGLWIADIDLAFIVGMTAGLLFIIPYFGPAVGVLLSLVLSLLKYGIDAHLLYVLGVFVGVQSVEGWVLTPNLVGDKVGLHPMVVMVALLVGGGLLGLWGVLLAIPISATIFVLLEEGLRVYKDSAFFQAGR